MPSGKPVAGAYVVSRTNDRDYWTFSEPTNAQGRFTSFFPASDLTNADPVEFSIQVALGRASYTTGATNPKFKRRSSATLDLKLPASGTVMAVPTSTPKVGATYRGLVVGVSNAGRRRQAALGHLAGRQGALRAGAPGLGTRDDAALLGERLPDVPDDPGRTGGARRSRDVADVTLAARRARPRRRQGVALSQARL